MKKLLLFTTILSASFTAFCPAHVIVSKPTPTTMPVASTVTPVATAQTSLNVLVEQLLAAISKPGTLTAEIRLQVFLKNIGMLQDGLNKIFIRDLNDKLKTDVLKCIEFMQDETTQLLELFKDQNSFFDKYQNRSCKDLLEIQKELNKLTEKINGVSLVWIAGKNTLSWMNNTGKNTLSWMNNNRLKTVALVAMAPFIIKTTSTVGHHAFQLGLNPSFKGLIKEAIEWSFTPAFAEKK